MLNTNYNDQPKTLTDLEELVDEFGYLHAKVKDFEETQKRYDHLKKLLADKAGLFGTGEVKIKGIYGYATFSAPSKTRKLTNVSAFMKAVGIPAFLSCISVSVSKAEKLLTPSQKEELFEVSQGSRRLKEAGKIADLLESASNVAKLRH